MKKVTTISALVILTGIAVYDVGFRKTGPDDGKVKAEALSDGEASYGSDRRRKVEPLTREEVLSRIPNAVGVFGSPRLTAEQEERMKIFEELGAHDGEAAVNFLFQKYGKGNGTYLPMIFAMRGWMENDMEGALSAFKGLLVSKKVSFVGNFKVAHSSNGLGGNLFVWKGESFHSGYS